jgi:hypothetical protein
VLTAIVIGFATTALFLVVMLASRGLTGATMWTGGAAMSGWLQHLHDRADPAAADRRRRS